MIEHTSLRLFEPPPACKLYEPEEFGENDDGALIFSPTPEDFGRSSSFDPHAIDNVFTFVILVCFALPIVVFLGWLCLLCL